MVVRITDKIAVNPATVTKVEEVLWSDASTTTHTIIHFVDGGFVDVPSEISFSMVISLLNERTTDGRD